MFYEHHRNIRSLSTIIQSSTKTGSMGLSFYNCTNVFPKGYKSDKGARKKAFVEGRISVEKIIKEKQMFVEHPTFCVLALDRFVKEKVFKTSYMQKK